MRRLGPLLLLALVPAGPAGEQSLRDFTIERAHRGEKQFRARIEFAAGSLIVRPGKGGQLYALALRYDAERFAPVGRYHAGTAEAHLGVESLGRGGIRVGRRDALAQTAYVELARSVPLSLDISVGAAESRLELGGLALADIALKTGASRTEVRFDTPTTGSCRSASIASGAGELQLHAMGNSRCRIWRIEGGVGGVTLDLDGEWPAASRMALEMALGGVTLEAPRALGVRVRLRGFLAGFEAEGFRKESGAWVSRNYATAERKLDVDVTSAIGGVTVVWRP